MKIIKKLAVILAVLSFVGMCIYCGNRVSAAAVGDQLLSPEAGWTRYDDTDEAISYSSNVENYLNDQDIKENVNYKNTAHGFKTNKLGETMKFNFKGNKIALIGLLAPRYTSKVEVCVDGKTEYFSAQSNTVKIPQTVLYKKEGLKEGIHSVVITNVQAAPNAFAWDARLDAVDVNEGGYLLPYNSAVIDVEPEKEKVMIDKELSIDVIMNGIKDISAADMLIKYDNTKLNFIGVEEFEGIKVINKEDKDGEIRFTCSSKGKDNIVNEKKILSKLKFKAVSIGEAEISIYKAKISDGIKMERDLEDEECGKAVINIEDYKDVNKDGEFTLLDLGIDARHYGEDPKTLIEYKTDIVPNGAIDDDDLNSIYKSMLGNENYKFKE